MTIAQAKAVNALLGWLLGDTPSVDDAHFAAVVLADAANTRLGAGITGTAVTDAWPDLAVPALGGAG